MSSLSNCSKKNNSSQSEKWKLRFDISNENLKASIIKNSTLSSTENCNDSLTDFNQANVFLKKQPRVLADSTNY